MKYTFALFVFSLLILSVSSQAQLQKINTIAGIGTYGFSGDGFNATAAQFHGPLGVAVDASGNVYVEDFFNLRVRKINTLGKITTIAGSGLGGNTGDSSIATSAGINPHGVAVDKNGNLYISDAIYGVVRKVNSLGIITRYAGTGVLGYSGDNGPARNAKLGSIHGIAFDPKGNLYIADAGHHVVRKVDTMGIITTIAGKTSITGADTFGYAGDNGPATDAVLDSPYAVAADKAGNVYITDYRNNVIRKINTADTITTFAGLGGVYGYTGDSGPASSAKLNGPVGIAVDTAGNLFIADAGNNVIRKVDVSGVITTVVGNGTFGFGGDLGYVNGANLFNPYGVAVDVYGNIYIADANNQRVRKTYYTLGLNNISASENLEVFPNPFSDHITLSGLSKSDRICIYDLAGKQVSDLWTADNDGTQTFSINNIAAGMYMLQVTDNNGIKKGVTKLVKE